MSATQSGATSWIDDALRAFDGAGAGLGVVAVARGLAVGHPRHRRPHRHAPCSRTWRGPTSRRAPPACMPRVDGRTGVLTVDRRRQHARAGTIDIAWPLLYSRHAPGLGDCCGLCRMGLGPGPSHAHRRRRKRLRRAAGEGGVGDVALSRQRRRSTSASATALSAAPPNTRGPTPGGAGAPPAWPRWPRPRRRRARGWRCWACRALRRSSLPAPATVPRTPRCRRRAPRALRNISPRWARNSAVSPAPASAARVVSCMPCLLRAQLVGTRRKLSALRPSLEPVLLRVEPRPLADARGELLPVVVLAGVAAQRLELALDRVGDVDDGVALRHRHEVHLVHRVRLEPLLLEQLHVGEGIARIGVHRAQRRLSRGEVVRMAREDALVIALRRLRHHPLRAALADHPGDVATQLDGRLHLAVGVAEKDDVGHAHDGGGGGLLAATQLRDLCPGHAPVRAARVPVGDDAVADLRPPTSSGRCCPRSRSRNRRGGRRRRGCVRRNLVLRHGRRW